VAIAAKNRINKKFLFISYTKLITFAIIKNSCLINIPKFNKKLLIAPLDWGFGHATRCISIINKLLEKNNEVIMAGGKPGLSILKEAFPYLETFPLPELEINYNKFLGSHRLGLLRQLNYLKKQIAAENLALKNYVESNKTIGTIISDNRYGIFHANCFNIFITHQLEIQTGFGKWANAKLQKLHYKQLKPFNEIWIPDFENAANSLSGDLSHTTLPKNNIVKYIGPQSRFTKPTINNNKEFNILAILSGPEPYKTKLLHELLNASCDGSLKIAIVYSGSIKRNIPAHITIYPHLNTNTLQAFIAASEFVLSRSGYSSIMDACIMQTKNIMLPTPGQTEQVYLAKRLQEKKWAYTINKLPNNLNELYNAASQFNYTNWPIAQNYI
jgi:uncharacterized protein (TIGR00661 family)